VSPATFVLWTTLVALLVVLALAGRAAASARREVKRIATRVDGYGGLPVVAALERAEADADRIDAAVGALAPLLARARAAVAVILRGPIPPGVVTALVRLRREIAAFRSFARR
jgi:hypothetical protein